MSVAAGWRVVAARCKSQGLLEASCCQGEVLAVCWLSHGFALREKRNGSARQVAACRAWTANGSVPALWQGVAGVRKKWTSSTRRVGARTG